MTVTPASTARAPMSIRRIARAVALAGWLVVASLALAACGSDDPGPGCSELSGSSWQPLVVGANYSHTTTTSAATQTRGGSLVAPGSSWTSGDEVVFTFSVGDLHDYGSISLVAEAINVSAGRNAYPVLVSLANDGNNKEWIQNTCGPYNGGGGGALFSCAGSSCTARGCVASTSAYNDGTHWIQRQLSNFGYGSVNTFPTCNFATGTAGNYEGAPACNFNQQNYFVGGKLPAGNYTARYVLVSTSNTSSSATGEVRLTVVTKDDNATGGTVDVNVVLVGNTLINQSRSANGKANLDMMFEAVGTHLAQAGILLGSVHAVEWGCEGGGDAFANPGATELGNLFKEGSGTVPSSTERAALNIYLVSAIRNDITSSGTVLGLSGGIPGPMINGTASSGLAFSALNQLDSMNPDCSGRCAITSQSASFREMGATIAHEIGHYLGLNHLSESSGTVHDQVYDTPYAPINSVSRSGGYYSFGSYSTTSQPFAGQTCQAACAAYSPSGGTLCPTVSACAFNHLMFWSAKNNLAGTTSGDGNLISTQSSRILNHSPFVQ